MNTGFFRLMRFFTLCASLMVAVFSSTISRAQDADIGASRGAKDTAPPTMAQPPNGAIGAPRLPGDMKDNRGNAPDTHSKRPSGCRFRNNDLGLIA